MLTRALSAAMLVCAVTLGSRASAFVDPLTVPAARYEKAATSRLTAITQAGSRVVAVGPRGEILLSDDRGASWRQARVPVSVDLVAVRFITPTRGWAAGHNGVVLRTDDGGESWSTQLNGADAARVIKARNDDLVAKEDRGAAAAMPEIEQLVAAGADKPIFDVLFLDENEGFVVGAFNLALRSTDGGKSWESLYDRTENGERLHLYSLVQHKGDVYAVGERGLILRWTKASARFEGVKSPYGGSFFGALSTGAGLVLFGMRGNAFMTPDEGKTWRRLEPGLKGGITGGSALGAGAFALASQAGEIAVSEDGGQKFNQVKPKKPMPYFGIVAADANHVALVGAAGVRLESVK
jgi:photosystem II stability/assembly factor-like uncharacterized protein